MNKNKAKYSIYFLGFAGTEFFMLLPPRTTYFITTTVHVIITASLQ